MIRNISIGIDVGSSMTRIVVGEFIKGEKNPKVIGVGESETRGMRHGYIVDPDLVLESIKKAVLMAESSSGVKVRKAFVGVSGTSLRGENSVGTVIVSKADGEVTGLDINKAMEDAENNLTLTNKKIVQSFPTAFRLDNKEVLGRIEGTYGTKLEVKNLVVTYSLQHMEDLIEVLARAGVETLDVVGAPIAVSEIALTDKQKIVGVALVNIGSETVSISVFENGLPVSVHSFSIGSNDITNDIALGFKITLEKADALKRGVVEENFSKKKLEEIIEARLSDIFELIENHLKKIKRSELLPAGIVFVGGGANISGIEEYAKSFLHLPASLGTTDMFGNTKTKLRDGSWFTALGLITGNKVGNTYTEGSLSNLFEDLKKAVKSSLKQLMP